MGRILDLGAGYDRYNSSPTPAEADAMALYADWKAVGGDLEAALQAAGEETDSCLFPFEPARA